MTNAKGVGEGCCRAGPNRCENARGVQENLWPKFIFEGAPLRATSSADHCSTRFANSNRLKMQGRRAGGTE